MHRTTLCDLPFADVDAVWVWPEIAFQDAPGGSIVTWDGRCSRRGVVARTSRRSGS